MRRDLVASRIEWILSPRDVAVIDKAVGIADVYGLAIALPAETHAKRVLIGIRQCRSQRRVWDRALKEAVAATQFDGIRALPRDGESVGPNVIPVLGVSVGKPGAPLGLVACRIPFAPRLIGSVSKRENSTHSTSAPIVTVSETSSA